MAQGTGDGDRPGPETRLPAPSGSCRADGTWPLPEAFSRATPARLLLEWKRGRASCKLLEIAKLSKHSE